MKHKCCMVGCNKDAEWTATFQHCYDRNYHYCNKHKEYQEIERRWDWKNFNKIREEFK